MDTRHPHAPAIDRIGSKLLKEKFGITRQAVSYWRRKGVPNEHRRGIFDLADELRIKVPELNKMR